MESVNFGMDYLQYSCFKTVTDLRIIFQFLSNFKTHKPFKPATSLWELCPTDMYTLMFPRCIKYAFSKIIYNNENQKLSKALIIGYD